MHELSVSFQLIAGYARLYGREETTKAVGRRISGLFAGPNDRPKLQPEISVLVQALEDLPASFKDNFLNALETSLEQLKLNPEIKLAREVMEEGIRTVVPSKMFAKVILPYGSHVTNIAESTLHRNWVQ